LSILNNCLPLHLEIFKTKLVYGLI